jgi:hypothetical protein
MKSFSCSVSGRLSRRRPVVRLLAAVATPRRKGIGDDCPMGEHRAIVGTNCEKPEVRLRIQGDCGDHRVIGRASGASWDVDDDRPELCAGRE